MTHVGTRLGPASDSCDFPSLSAGLVYLNQQVCYYKKLLLGLERILCVARMEKGMEPREAAFSCAESFKSHRWLEKSASQSL